MEDLIPEDNKPNNQEEPKRESPLKRRGPKPDIEGITVPFASRTPKIGPKITSSDKPSSLKDEPDDTMRVSNEKITLPHHKSGFVKFFLTVVFLAILGISGYELYIRYFNKPAQPGQQDNYADSFDADAENQPVDYSNTFTDANATTSTSTDVTVPADVAGASSTPATTIPPSVPSSPTLKVNTISTGYLNVRQSPSTASSIITKIHPGETYPYSEVQNDWYHITLPDGKTGWIAGQYVSKIQ